jgi:hypothetical protein
MPRVSLRHAETLIAEGKPVVSHTGNLAGDTSFDDTGWEYTVFSYGVPIGSIRRQAIRNPDGSYAKDDQGKVALTEELWITDKKYSVTTSRHTNLARRALTLQLKRGQHND